MKATGCDRSSTGDSGGRHRGRGVGRRPVAELAEVVLAPAAHRAVLKKGAAIKGAEVDGSDPAGSARSELLGLADGDGGTGRSDGDGLRTDLGVGQSADKSNSYGADVRFSFHR